MPKEPKNGASIREVYEILDKMRGELIASINRVDESVEGLRKDFSNFEAGRLTRVEISIKTLEEKLKPLERFVYGLIGVVMLAVLGALLALVF